MFLTVLTSKLFLNNLNNTDNIRFSDLDQIFMFIEDVISLTFSDYLNMEELIGKLLNEKSNFENIFAFVNYTRTVDGVKSRLLFDGVNQVSSPINLSNADESFSANGNYGRTFYKYYKASINAGVNWSKFNNKIFVAV